MICASAPVRWASRAVFLHHQEPAVGRHVVGSAREKLVVLLFEQHLDFSGLDDLGGEFILEALPRGKRSWKAEQKWRQVLERALKNGQLTQVDHDAIEDGATGTTAHTLVAAIRPALPSAGKSASGPGTGRGSGQR